MLTQTLELHSEGITHTDIRPENVEFLDDRTFEEMVYHQSKFVSVVCSSFYARNDTHCLYFRDCCGLPSFVLHFTAVLGSETMSLLVMTSIDRRRWYTVSVIIHVPSHCSNIEDWGYSTHSDAFSVGCLIAEMVLQRPLFIPCNSVRFYQHEKTLQFQTVLGPFSEDMIRKIHSKYSTIFDRHDGDSIYSGSGVSEEVLTFAANADSLQVCSVHVVEDHN